jgi:trehalose 6-phosphate phosphatase
MIDPSFLPRLFPTANPPTAKSDWALFMDLDGTLLDIAPSPERVVIPSDLVADLEAASNALGGALAIVTGRMMSEVDALLSPLRLPGAGEHGAVVRLPNGQCEQIDATVPSSWFEALTAVAAEKPGVFIERKRHSVVAHYRRSAHHEDFLRGFCGELVAGSESDFEILQCKMALEIRPCTANKARPVERLMGLKPFDGRRPVFVGDDVTDRDGFRAAVALGGDGYDVFLRFAGRPKEVRAWLKSFASLGKR